MELRSNETAPRGDLIAMTCEFTEVSVAFSPRSRSAPCWFTVHHRSGSSGGQSDEGDVYGGINNSRAA
ncbi:hypothetical protein [Streptomyces humicola]|nr:hypothetical protein [Streptomyces humicola]